MWMRCKSLVLVLNFCRRFGVDDRYADGGQRCCQNGGVSDVHCTIGIKGTSEGVAYTNAWVLSGETSYVLYYCLYSEC
jgi:hypothetical protein